MTKEDDHITFDFEGTSPQNAGSVNCAWHGAMGSLFVALAGILFWDVPWNGGMIVPVTAKFPEGSMINCRFPASCAQCPPAPGLQITAAATMCIGKMLALTEEFRGDLNAGWAGGVSFLSYGGIDQYGTRTGSMLMDCFAAGCGAGYDRDGVDTGGIQMTPESDCADVETYESAGPILYLFRKHRMDSGGPGKFRGGAGLELAHMVHNTPGLYISEHGLGEKITNTPGMWGGYPSCGSIQVLLEDGEAVKEKLARGEIPATVEECMRIKGAKKMPLYYGCMATEGMTGVFICTGGGGYGDPLEREPEKVRVDVKSMIHSPWVAREVYGVILDEKSSEVDLEKTNAKREEIKKNRLKMAGKEGLLKGRERGSKEGKFFTEYLIIDEDGKICCRKCNHFFCDHKENYKEYALRAEVTPSTIGPMRPDDTEWCAYREFYCPGCAVLLDVDVVAQGDPV
ncbi:MAG: hydantoinase B/oxoprolinase family protein, partial [Syntrophales bacterium]|nr:hydantoinase B/oxoprolinase family protein [Syntrophales bacterium]